MNNHWHEINQISKELENQLTTTTTLSPEPNEVKIEDNNLLIITPETNYFQQPKPSHRIVGRIKL
jgi:hypothetical protein